MEYVFYDIPDDSSKSYVVCRNTAHSQTEKHVLLLLNALKPQYNLTPTRHETRVARLKTKSVDLTWSFIMLRDIV